MSSHNNNIQDSSTFSPSHNHAHSDRSAGRVWANPVSTTRGAPNPLRVANTLAPTTLAQTGHIGVLKSSEDSGAYADRDQAAISALKSQLEQLRGTKSPHYTELGHLSFWPNIDRAKTEVGDHGAHFTAIGKVQSLHDAIDVTYLPISLANAICLDPVMTKAKGFEVALVQGGSAKLVELDNWSLMNLDVKEVLGLVKRLQDETGLSVADIKRSVEPYTIQTIGLAEMHRSYLRDIQEFPVLVVSQTCAQAWLEAAALAGVGTRQILAIDNLPDQSMDTGQLRDVLDDCIQRRRPVLQLVAGEVPSDGSVDDGHPDNATPDPLGQLLDLRSDYFAKGLAFPLRVDGLSIS